jgi:hypothetical protein
MSPMALQSASIVRAPMRLRWTLSLAKTISIGSGLDIGVEDLAVHGLVDHPRRGQAIATQSGNEGLGGRRAGHADLLRGDLRLDLEDDLLGPPNLAAARRVIGPFLRQVRAGIPHAFHQGRLLVHGYQHERARQAEGHFPIVLGGCPAYREKCDEVTARGYEGFTLT